MPKMWSSGWNVPGYLPEVEPRNYHEWERSRDALMAALDDAADDWQEDSPESARLYAEARELFAALPNGAEATARIGNYVWWLASVDLPESELTESS